MSLDYPTVQESAVKTAAVPRAVNLQSALCMFPPGSALSPSPSPSHHICLSLCLSACVCLVALCHYYGPICVNANIPFIIGWNGFRQGSGGLHTSPLTFSPWWHPLAVRSQVRVPDLLSDHWLL